MSKSWTSSSNSTCHFACQRVCGGDSHQWWQHCCPGVCTGRTAPPSASSCSSCWAAAAWPGSSPAAHIYETQQVCQAIVHLPRVRHERNLTLKRTDGWMNAQMNGNPKVAVTKVWMAKQEDDGSWLAYLNTDSTNTRRAFMWIHAMKASLKFTLSHRTKGPCVDRNSILRISKKKKKR